MSTGISMSSVNKIKELSESGDYSLALDILEHQDLTKSLSPQFIRICGEVYYENNRYDEARAALVKAHSMAPVGNKIIFSIIKLYLSMGLYSLAEKYYEIYKFNQTERDAGTFRIEYMIGKSKHLSAKELYGILISANELASDDEWDYEMLLLYSCMGKQDRLKNESEEFKINHKGSRFLDKLDILKTDSSYAEKIIYCYPSEEKQDTIESQAETREFEKKVLNDDELRMHPKDAKIVLMVEDNEPVPNSVKFKQMLMKSKEKKKQKKEEQGEGNVEDTAEDKKGKGSGWFKNRLSKKDEEAALEVLAETENKEIDKEKLLNEVMQDDNKYDSITSDEEIKPDDATDNLEAIVNENTEENDLDVLSEEEFDAGIDDFEFQAEDDFTSVVVVDSDIAEEEIPETTEPEEELTEATEQQEEISEETKYQEEAGIQETVEVQEAADVSEDVVSDVSEDIATSVSEDTYADVSEDIVTSMSEDTYADVQEELEEHEHSEIPVEVIEEVIEENNDIEEKEEAESCEASEEAEESESAESAEGLDEDKSADLYQSEADETENNNAEKNVVPEIMNIDDFTEKATSFDFDDAINSLDIYDIDEEDSFNQADEGDINIPYELSDEEAVDVDMSIQEETVVEEDLIEEKTLKETFADEKIENLPEEISVEEEIESLSDEISVEEEIESLSDETSVEEEIENLPEETVVEEDNLPEETPVEVVEESQVEESTSIFEESTSIVEEATDDKEIIQEETPKKNIDFPVFRTSLFPDYNSGKPFMEEHVNSHVKDVSSEGVSEENLLKEQELIKQTDELLARLGIELGTKYSSNTDFFNLHGNSENGISGNEEPEDAEEDVTENKAVEEQTQAGNNSDGKVSEDFDVESKKNKGKKKFSLKKK